MMRQTLLNRKVKHIELKAIKQKTEVMNEIIIKVDWDDGEDGLYVVNFIREIKAYKTSPKGMWRFNPISIRKYEPN